MKKAFTLAEILIVLVVIGILLSVLLPTVKNIKANEKVVKFKKGHNALLNAVQELVVSDKYYISGDLGTKPNGTMLTPINTSDHEYLIKTIADVLNVKKVNPKQGRFDGASALLLVAPEDCLNGAPPGALAEVSTILDYCSGKYATATTIENKKNKFSALCNVHSAAQAEQIVTSDGLWFWDAYPIATFGDKENPTDNSGRRTFSLKDVNGFTAVYKLFCMDIDGVPSNATKDDCINECPFAYGIGVDGKIFTSKRVDEWLEKSVNKK